MHLNVSDYILAFNKYVFKFLSQHDFVIGQEATIEGLNIFHHVVWSVYIFMGLLIGMEVDIRRAYHNDTFNERWMGKRGNFTDTY